MADQESEPRRKRGERGPSLAHDTQSPAYLVIYGVFGSLTNFCDKTGIALGTAHGWVVCGLIPAGRQGHILAVAAAEGLALDPLLFVPRAKAA